MGDARRIASAASLMVNAAKDCRLVVVSSAMSGVTDALIEAAKSAADGERGKALVIVSDLLEQHERTLDALVPEGDEPCRGELRELTARVTDVLRAVAHLHLLSARTRDVVLSVGEKLAVRLLAAAMRRAGATAVPVDGDTLVDTDDAFGEASPLPGVSDRGIAASLKKRLDAGEIPVVTGFVGRAPDGATTTLGRGGSDHSATLVAAALTADEVTIWTDVDGVYTADPRVVPEAHLLRQLNYREAAELSYYGAKILHPRTILPCVSATRSNLMWRERESTLVSRPGPIRSRRSALFVTKPSCPSKARAWRESQVSQHACLVLWQTGESA